MDVMKERSPKELSETVSILRTRVNTLESELQRKRDECELLKAQNDYLQELLTAPEEDDPHERDTIPARPPKVSNGPDTKPSSPKAIRLDELAHALEASDTTRRERDEGMRYDSCPICGRTDEHAHDFIFDDDEKPN